MKNKENNIGFYQYDIPEEKFCFKQLILILSRAKKKALAVTFETSKNTTYVHEIEFAAASSRIKKNSI